jgi:hypothetical protein
VGAALPRHMSCQLAADKPCLSRDVEHLHAAHRELLARLWLQVVPVQACEQPHRHLRPQRLCRVAAPLGMGDELADPLGRGWAAHLQRDRHLLERPHRRLEPELLRRAEAASDVDRGVLDLDLVQRREPRRLGELSSRHREQQVLQRGRRQPGPATLGWLVGFPHARLRDTQPTMWVLRSMLACARMTRLRSAGAARARAARSRW